MTGRSQPFLDSKALAKSLTRLPSIDAEAAQSIVGRPTFDMDPAKKGFLFEHDQDLYYATFDGATAVRLTSQPGREQWPQFSPDGKHVAFVRDFDLYAVDIATPTERRLTTGGREDLRHGQADWVYFEEVWNRRWPSFWWSPDSKRIAFMEFDDAGVPYHTVLDDASSSTSRNVEIDALSPFRRDQPEGPARHRRRRWRVGAMGGPLGLLPGFVADHRGGLVAGQLVGLLLRPGPRPDLARRAEGHPANRRDDGPDPSLVPRHDQGLDR